VIVETDPSSFSDPPPLHGEQPHEIPRAGESPRRRSRRRASRDDPSGRERTGRVWKTAATVVPPVATIGAALALIGWMFPALALVRSVQLLSWATIAALGVSLVLMLAGVGRGSRRVRRREFWIALAAALLVTGMLVVVQRRAQVWQTRTGSAAEQVPVEPGEQ
jgi:predicted permease